MNLGAKGDIVVESELQKILSKIKNKYWKLGKAVALSKIPDDLKSQFYSLGNDMDKFLTLTKSLEAKNVTTTK